MGRRYSIAEKKYFLSAFLEREKEHGEKQKTFCQDHGLGEAMFSKWLSHVDEILQTSSSRKNRERSGDKRQLQQYLDDVQATGLRLDVTDVMKAAKRLCPGVFATVSNYNGRYVMCARMLQELAPRQPRLLQIFEKEHAETTPRDASPTLSDEMVAAGVFTHVDRNQFRQVKEDDLRFVDDTTDCDCKDKCGVQCPNRIMNWDCGPWNCRHQTCSNRRLQVPNALIGHLELFETEFTGFGLRSHVAIPPDTFVIEYVGEYMQSREYCGTRGSLANTYFIETADGYGIDAREYGNLSRFVNHSCDPNLDAVKWVVRGVTRVAFVTRKQVHPGVELTFNYGEKKFSCQCIMCRTK